VDISQVSAIHMRVQVLQAVFEFE